MVKNMPVKAGDIRDAGSVPGSEEGMTSHSSILVWRMLWTEEPVRLQSIGSQRIRHDRDLAHTQHARTH